MYLLVILDLCNCSFKIRAKKFSNYSGLLVEQKRIRFWSWRSEVQISGRPSRTVLLTARLRCDFFFEKKLCRTGAMTWRWALQTPYRPTLWRNTVKCCNLQCTHYDDIRKLFKQYALPKNHNLSRNDTRIIS